MHATHCSEKNNKLGRSFFKTFVNFLNSADIDTKVAKDTMMAELGPLA